MYKFIDKRYGEIPDTDKIDPTTLPIVDRYLEKRGKPMRSLTKGRWWVFFLGDQKVNNAPSDNELLEWVRLMDIAADNFMTYMKLDFLGNGLPKHKLYVYFTSTGTNGFPAAFSGSNDGPYGVNTAIFDFGAIMHEMGHACYPRAKEKDRVPHYIGLRCAADFWYAKPPCVVPSHDDGRVRCRKLFWMVLLPINDKR